MEFKNTFCNANETSYKINVKYSKPEEMINIFKKHKLRTNIG